MKDNYVKEKILNPANGMAVLVLNSAALIAFIGLIVYFSINFDNFDRFVSISIITILSILTIISGIIFNGISIVRTQEAKILMLFGKYHGTIKKDGIFFVNPLSTYFSPKSDSPTSGSVNFKLGIGGEQSEINIFKNNAISLKVKTINNDKQKINDLLGNPIIVDTMVVWRIVDTAKAIFNVDNYIEYLSMQCDSSLRSIVSLYPYDSPENSQKCLRSSSVEIAEQLKKEIQEKVENAGLEIIEAKITNLFYAPEIATAMLQRQQAAAVIDAKQTIVEGAVDIVELALKRLSESMVVELDEERKAAMVSNLLVVLCSGSEAKPVINSGSLY